MSNDTKQPAAGELTQAMTEAVRTVIQEVRPKQFDYSEYVQKLRDEEPKLARPVFQNGHPIQIRGCSKDTITHLDNLKPGRYIGGRVTVEIKGDAPNEELHISYPWANVNDRMINYSLFSSFSDLVQKIHREQNGE